MRSPIEQVYTAVSIMEEEINNRLGCMPKVDTTRLRELVAESKAKTLSVMRKLKYYPEETTEQVRVK